MEGGLWAALMFQPILGGSRPRARSESRSADKRARAWPSSCRTRSRVRSSSWPMASSVQGRLRSRSAARGSGARRSGQRIECAPDALAPEGFLGLVEGSAASRSAKRSPSSPSSSAPTVWLSDTDAWAAPAPRRRCWIGRPVASASSSFVASRAELHLEPARGAGQLLLPLDDVHRDADRPGVVGHGTLHRLANPPGGIGRKLVAAPPVELSRRPG